MDQIWTGVAVTGFQADFWLFKWVLLLKLAEITQKIYHGNYSVFIIDKLGSWRIKPVTWVSSGWLIDSTSGEMSIQSKVGKCYISRRDFICWWN